MLNRDKFLTASIDAGDMSRALYAAYWAAYTSDPMDKWSEHQVEKAENLFRDIAAALGYRVERTKEPANV